MTSWLLACKPKHVARIWNKLICFNFSFSFSQWPVWCTIFYYIYYNPLHVHVSSNILLILRRSDCINLLKTKRRLLMIFYNILHLLLDSVGWVFPSGFPTKPPCCALMFSHIRATFPAHLILVFFFWSVRFLSPRSRRVYVQFYQLWDNTSFS